MSGLMKKADFPGPRPQACTVTLLAVLTDVTIAPLGMILPYPTCGDTVYKDKEAYGSLAEDH